MVAPRKFRNSDERNSVRVELITQKLARLPLSDEEDLHIKNILDTFCQKTQGQTLQGTFYLKSIDRTLSYSLPGRRMLQLYMKIDKQENENENGNNELKIVDLKHIQTGE